MPEFSHEASAAEDKDISGRIKPSPKTRPELLMQLRPSPRASYAIITHSAYITYVHPRYSHSFYRNKNYTLCEAASNTMLRPELLIFTIKLNHKSNKVHLITKDTCQTIPRRRTITQPSSNYNSFSTEAHLISKVISCQELSTTVPLAISVTRC